MGVSYRAKDNKRLYSVWGHMKDRCYSKTDPSYKRYGGRGITVCDEWKNSFRAFCKWALEHGFDSDAKFGVCTLDRIDNDKGYSPDNCRWVDMITQARNRRSNKIITFHGESHTMTEWSEITGLKKTTLAKRLDLGWNVEDALTKPLIKSKSSLHRRKRDAV